MSVNAFSDKVIVLHAGRRVAARGRVDFAAVLIFIAALIGIAALYGLAGQRLLAVWAAVALFGWMFVAGAARASTE